MRNTPGSGDRYFWDIAEVTPAGEAWPHKEVRIFDRHRGMGRYGENHILTCRSEEYADLVCDALNSVAKEIQAALTRTAS